MQERNGIMENQRKQSAGKNSDQPAHQAEGNGFYRELQRIFFLVAPIALRTPISLVRSVTRPA